MRDQEWDFIEAGDLLDYLPPTRKDDPNPTPRRFQVFKLDAGKVYAVRMLGNVDDGTTSITTTETAVISRGTARWSLVRLKTRAVATGGFIVTRAADNHQTPEYDKCPSPLDRSTRKPQTLEDRR